MLSACAHTPTQTKTPRGTSIHNLACTHREHIISLTHTSPAHSRAAKLILGRGYTGVVIAKLVFAEEAVETHGPWSPRPRLSILLQRHTQVTHGVSLVPPLHHEGAGWMGGEGTQCHVPSSTGAHSASVPRKWRAKAYREREVQSREELNIRMVIYSR